MDSLTLYVPARIEFGEGSLERSGIALSSFGSRALVVADQVGRDSGVVSALESALEGSGIQAIIYETIPANPTSSAVGEIVKLGRAGRALFVIGVGDEMVLSLAKLAASFIPKDIDIDSLFRSDDSGISLPFAAIPTRGGNSFVLGPHVPYVDSRDRSIAIADVLCSTDALILDPETAKDANPTILSYLVSDYILGSLEGLCSRRTNFISEMYIRQELVILSEIISPAERENDGVSILNLYRAGFLSAISGTIVPPGIGTALSYWIAAKARVPRIAVASVLAPHVAAFLQDALPERMETAIATLPADGAETIAEALGGFLGSDGLPTRLRDLEIEKADLLTAAYGAHESDMVRLSSAPVSADELHDLLERSF